MPSYKQIPEELLLLQPHLPALGHEEQRDVVADRITLFYFCQGNALAGGEHIIQDGAQDFDPLLDALLVG